VIKLPIRNNKSTKEVKPRVFDALIDGNDIYLEVKYSKKSSEIIALIDVLKQIEAVRKQQQLKFTTKQ